MPSNLEPKYEEHFTAIVDFLGFSEGSRKVDEGTRSKVLGVLKDLSGLRGEFAVKSTPVEGTKSTTIKPAVSTFSDHIVVSWPLQPVCDEFGSGETLAAIILSSDFTRLLASIAAQALRIGFLVRGGASIGGLYHANGVVFGEALVDAYEIESRTSIYPRVVLSPRITSRPTWLAAKKDIEKYDDGLYHFDYFNGLLLDAVRPGPGWAVGVKLWFDEVLAITARNLAELQTQGKVNKFAKWAWFVHQFRSSLEKLDPQFLTDLGISLEGIKWPM